MTTITAHSSTRSPHEWSVSSCLRIDSVVTPPMARTFWSRSARSESSPDPNSSVGPLSRTSSCCSPAGRWWSSDSACRRRSNRPSAAPCQASLDAFAVVFFLAVSPDVAQFAYVELRLSDALSGRDGSRARPSSECPCGNSCVSTRWAVVSLLSRARRVGELRDASGCAGVDVSDPWGDSLDLRVRRDGGDAASDNRRASRPACVHHVSPGVDVWDLHARRHSVWCDPLYPGDSRRTVGDAVWSRLFRPDRCLLGPPGVRRSVSGAEPADRDSAFFVLGHLLPGAPASAGAAGRRAREPAVPRRRARTGLR